MAKRVVASRLASFDQHLVGNGRLRDASALLDAIVFLRRVGAAQPVPESTYRYPHGQHLLERSVIVGYARVSTMDQNLELQLDALEAAGCERVFRDQVSGAREDRPGWREARAALREGDTLVVWRLDRLGRSLKHLIEVITELDEQGIGFRSVQENLDTTTPGGRLVFHVFGALAQFERELIQERTKAGLAAARARGRMGGRPVKLGPREVATARRLLEDSEQTVTGVAELLGVGRSTLYRALERHAQAEAGEASNHG